MENIQELASDEVCKYYQLMHDNFEEYLSAVQNDMFQQAFRYGYEKGLEAGKRKKTA
jgi:hypothetical protein